MLSYSFHISSKNHSINTKTDLKNVSDHNTRKYKEVKENNLEMNLKLSHHNEIIKGTDNCYKDVKDFYREYFEESRIEFNQKQKRDDRKIYDYFEKISEDSKKQLAVEIIVQLGDKNFWKNKTIDEKKQMTNVFKEQLNFLEKQLPDFKICNAIIHYDEASPHIQLVGVPVAENFKQGMKKQVSKKAVFTRESLKNLQEKMRENAIENFNKFYRTKEVLKPLEKGRNKDYLIKEIKEIERIKQEKKKIEKNFLVTKNELEKEITKLINKKIFLEDDITEATEKYNVFLDKNQKIEEAIKINQSIIEKQKERFAKKISEERELERNIEFLKEEEQKKIETFESLKRDIEEIQKFKIISEPNPRDLKKINRFKENISILDNFFSLDEMQGIKKFFYTNEIRLNEEQIKGVKNILSDLSSEVIVSEKIIEKNLEQKEIIEKYKEIIDSQKNNLTEINNLREENHFLQEENTKINKVLDVFSERYSNFKEKFEEVKKELFPEKTNLWINKIKKDKGRNGLER